MTVEPSPTSWLLEPAPDEHPHDLWAVGADLAPGTILAGYRVGLFPMPLREDALGWFSPAARGVIPLDERPRRTLRRVGGRYEIRFDTAFVDVARGCADPGRAWGWITDEVVEAYARLHELGWAHSIEAWDEEGLAGGLYGVEVGGLFAAESMFQRRPDASKASLLALLERLRATETRAERLLDVQWVTEHLALLGAVEVSRSVYRARLTRALELQPAFGGADA